MRMRLNRYYRCAFLNYLAPWRWIAEVHRDVSPGVARFTPVGARTLWVVKARLAPKFYQAETPASAAAFIDRLLP